MQRTKAQNIELHKLINNCGIGKDIKKDLVLQFSNDRTDSSKFLSYQECDQLIKYLRQVDPADKMRKKILSICHEMSWENKDGTINIYRLNGFLQKSGVIKKPLNKLSVKELPLVVTQFEQMLIKHYNHVRQHQV